ncbi:MAG: SUMF1/EgtB/PvdO family nonheme iron enzyme [Chlorobiaceae bacterium]|nr:SUMF1/EgtB/PvdO family nonheme iron enzyme [Chlorobiaceae bacterium]
MLLLAGAVDTSAVCAKEGGTNQVGVVPMPASGSPTSETKAANEPASGAQTIKSDVQKGLMDYIPAAAVITAIALLFGVYQYRKRISDAQKKKEAELDVQEKHDDQINQSQNKKDEKRYRERLRVELLKSSIFGMPSIDGENEEVDQPDTFVSLDLDAAESYCNEGFELSRVQRSAVEPEFENPVSALQKAIQSSRMLLIIGEPGAGKTTIIKHFALMDDLELTGFSTPVPVMYLPLSKMIPGEENKSLYTKLSEIFNLGFGHNWFKSCLETQPTLVLLDGLDEISDKEQRKKVCKWISEKSRDFQKAFFVMTTRDKAFGVDEKNALQINKRIAYVKRFTDKQQKEFLHKWFRAALLRDYRLKHRHRSEEDEHSVQEVAAQKADALVAHLARPQNIGMKELAGIPLLLQFMAIFWKQSGALGMKREDLYRNALDFLLYFRENEKGINSLLLAEDAKTVLEPVALRMQDNNEETLQESVMFDVMQPEIENLGVEYRRLRAEDVCHNLVERNAVIDHTGSTYQFRHKTFREYLAATKLISLMDQRESDEWLKKLVDGVGDQEWKEPLLFFMALATTGKFEKFMLAFFDAERSKLLDEKTLSALKELILKVPKTSLTVFKEILSAQGTSLNEEDVSNRQSYALECLKTIGSRAAVEIAQDFMVKHPAADTQLIRKAAEVVELIDSGAYSQSLEHDLNTEELVQGTTAIGTSYIDTSKRQALIDVIQSSVEPGAQYILIRGGSYRYSVTGKDEDVDDLYVAKYPVTNRLYRRFINYLQSEDKERAGRLPVADFLEKLSGIDGFREYLNKDKNIATMFRSERDDDRRFKEDEQPVVSISWYAARAYCLWLSMIESGGKKDDLYRLPTEIEWEWAAAGKEQREYPWRVAEQPSPKLANYGDNVGATTPVGSYPDGATPEGLYDMAGNVWEWMENLSGDKLWPSARALRGGSWGSSSDNLRCSARDRGGVPAVRGYVVGFRVVRPGLAVEL